MAALGVPDYAGVHRWLDPPAPLQITHGVFVEVTGQHCGNPRTHASGWKLEPALGGNKAKPKWKKTNQCTVHVVEKEKKEKKTQWVCLFFSCTSIHTIVVSHFGISSFQTEGHGCLQHQALSADTQIKFHILKCPYVLYNWGRRMLFCGRESKCAIYSMHYRMSSYSVQWKCSIPHPTL